MEQNAKIYVAGHRGLVGSALTRILERSGYQNIVKRSYRELDLRNRKAVEDFFQDARPEYVFMAAAKVGGIYANDTYPADFIYDNLSIQVNIIDCARKWGVGKLLFLGSSCIYPRDCPQPMREEYLLSGYLERTNEPYAVAKIAGIKMCDAYRRQHGCRFISVMPTNLYGPGDNFDLENSHVIPALMRKFHEAKHKGDTEVFVWGTGKPRREFLHVEDLAESLVFLMRKYDEAGFINVGTGGDISIGELADLVAEVVGYRGKVVFDTSKPDGTPRKLLDVSRIFALGWRPKVELKEGLEDTYRWFEKHYPEVRGIHK